MKLLSCTTMVLAAGVAHAATQRATSLMASSDEVESMHNNRNVRGLAQAHLVHDLRLNEPIMTNASFIPGSAWSKSSKEEKEVVEKAAEWTTSAPDSTDFNEETYVDGWPFSIESTCATLLCMALASAPILLAAVAEEKLTRTHMLECCALVAWLGGVLYLFTSVLKFQSVHWTGYRPLTIVEATYLLSQILTTVGYGDITPAFPRGQVWVGFNVIVGLMLYGSIVMEVVGIVYGRVEKYLAKKELAKLQSQSQADRGRDPLKDWADCRKIDYKPMIDSAIFFGSMAGIGITFFYLKEGEGKTLLQCCYMSVITLSTVGFGAFVPITEAGKVFGALWMLVGVSALAALITSFIDLIMRMKAVQHIDMVEEREKFDGLVNQCCAGKGGEAMDKLAFLKFALMYKHDVSETDIKLIENRFQCLGPVKGYVSLDKVDQAERPPLGELNIG